MTGPGPVDRGRRPRPDAEARPHPSRFDPDRPDHQEAVEAHGRAVAAGAPGYRDPATGLFVMTARYLLDRGHCCDRGCRHCPWVGGPTASGDTGHRQRDEETT